MTSCSARRVRALAVVAVLLCGLVTVAPLIERTSAGHHSRIHVVKIVGLVADQHASPPRLDQPGATLQHAPQNSDRAVATEATTSLTAVAAASIDTVRTRGPPASAS
ncbi:MAG: hypothetical protein ABI429_10230 [Jatrophihabitantaceae bacterium]